MSDNKQTLRDTYVGQEDGMTIMEFTKLLVKDGEVPILEEGVNIFFMQEVAVLLDIMTMNVYLPERILYNIKTLGIR